MLQGWPDRVAGGGAAVDRRADAFLTVSRLGFRFDRGVMTEVLVVVHEPTRNMLIEIQIVSGAATAERYSFYPPTNRVNRILTVAATGMLMAALTVAPTINHHNLLFLPSGCVGLISWTACIGG